MVKLASQRKLKLCLFHFKAGELTVNHSIGLISSTYDTNQNATCLTQQSQQETKDM